MIPPTQWLIDPSWYFSNHFKLFPISGVAIQRYFSNDMSIEKGDLWKFNFSFVFFPQYFIVIFLMIWYVLSMLTPFLPCLMVILRSFSVDPSWKVQQNILSNSSVSVSEQNLFLVSERKTSVSTAIIDLYV